MKTETLLRVYKAVRKAAVKQSSQIKPIRKHYNIHSFG